MYYYSSEPSGQGVYWISLPDSVFVSGGSLETVSLETPKTLMFAPCSQHVHIQCNVLCREMRHQLSPQEDHCSPPQASSLFHAIFVVLPPSIVFPKTTSLQPAIDPELFMDVFMDSVLAFSATLILRVTQSIVRQNCPLCHQYFQNTLPTIALQLTGLLSFMNGRLCAPLFCRLKIILLLFLALKNATVTHPILTSFRHLLVETKGCQCKR